VERDGIWRESFAPGAFLAASEPVPVTLQHDGPTIGHVTVVTACREWHLADMLIEAHDGRLDRVRVRTPVSIDARSVRRDDDDDLRIRRHTLVRLDAVAILGAGEVPWFQHAKIVGVRELPVRPTVGRRSTPASAASCSATVMSWSIMFAASSAASRAACSFRSSSDPRCD